MNVSDESEKSDESVKLDELNESDIKSIVEGLQKVWVYEDFKDIDSLIKYLMKNANLDEICIKKSDPFINPTIYDESHINYKNDELIQKVIDYCMEKNKNKEYRFMLVVSNLFPELIKGSYKNIVGELSKQLNYSKVPSEWCKKEKFISIREELWGYKFPSDNTLPSSIFDGFEKRPRHYATLCYVPLPGLCTYPKDDNIIIPRGLSPFAKFILSGTPIAEVFQDDHASSKIFKSQYFQAIVKYKWHAFARKSFLTCISLYFILFLLFNTAIIISTKKDRAIVEYSEEVMNAAINSYIAAMNMTINDINDTNNMTKTAEIKSDIETIYWAIYYKAFDEAIIKRSVVAINDAAITAIKDITAIDSVIINNTYVEQN
ncbi:hypothetical protein Glove_99g373 [Diversispora epigaea]|uniref:Uncharacterized protein n=1 Tax=Diversispora epigaea TaxID=1348612 RepID=A0A397J403_9GLOM|nr:hypothetical protein Glove_99g373 [Diversispora epigaea]